MKKSKMYCLEKPFNFILPNPKIGKQKLQFNEMEKLNLSHRTKV